MCIVTSYTFHAIFLIFDPDCSTNKDQIVEQVVNDDKRSHLINSRLQRVVKLNPYLPLPSRCCEGWQRYDSENLPIFSHLHLRTHWSSQRGKEEESHYQPKISYATPHLDGGISQPLETSCNVQTLRNHPSLQARLIAFLGGARDVSVRSSLFFNSASLLSTLPILRFKSFEFCLGICGKRYCLGYCVQETLEELA
jgi:hypothetical protein